jgi:iron complex outermembrane recepter protein
VKGAVCSLVLGLLLVCQVQAQQAVQPSLPQVDVFATTPSARWREQPQPTTVITAKDIAQSGATTLADLLSLHGNLNLQSYFGHDKSAAIDIRGMGVTAGSNVLILVDGVRLNANDLSGPDLSSVVLQHIERIDIVRGGGSVKEGSGAVGGVIRITTRRSLAANTTSVNTHARLGSYGSHDVAASASIRRHALQATLQLKQGESDGYRDNGELDTKSASLSLVWSMALGTTLAEVNVKAGRQQDSYGLPGPVSREDFQGTSQQRRSTQHPLDGGQTTVNTYEMGMQLDWGSAGRLDWRTQYRDRVNPYLIGVAPGLALSEQANQILVSQFNHRLEYATEGTLVRQWPYDLTLGGDFMRGDYERWSNGQYIPNGTRLLGHASSNGWYAEGALHPSDSLSLHAGVRSGQFTSAQNNQTYSRVCTYSTGPIPVELGCTPYAYRPAPGGRQNDWHNHAAELGFSLQINQAFSVKASASQHYRAPNIDELLLADTALRPQEGSTWQASVRHEYSQALSWAATLFALENRDEIYYGVDAQGLNTVNRNRSGKTSRRGLELESQWLPSASTKLTGQISYLVPKAQGHVGDIPLVPRTTASMQFEWRPYAHWAWHLDGKYVGSREDGNNGDANQYFPGLPAYQVWGTALRYSHKSAQLKFGINNLLGEIYSTQAYSKTYYPMPERQVYFMLDWSL